MKVRTYTVLSEAVLEGARGFLWNDLEESSIIVNQGRIEHLAEKLETRIMNAICERFDFEDEN
jgi:hypothetical protein